MLTVRVPSPGLQGKTQELYPGIALDLNPSLATSWLGDFVF